MLQQIRPNCNTLKLQGNTSLPLMHSGNMCRAAGQKDSEQTTTSLSWIGLQKFGERTLDLSLAKYPKKLQTGGPTWKTNLHTTEDIFKTE